MLLRYLLAIGIWILWVIPFVPKVMAPREKAVVKDRSARWGLLLESLSYPLVWALLETEVPAWRLVAGVALGLLGAALSWRAVRDLDKQWRVDAGLNADHQLVQSGAYGLVRNPIYTGMFLMLLATGALLTWWPALLIAVVVFVIGTEIRVRSEEKLLRSRFGKEFEIYAMRVPAYLPWIR